MQTRISLLLIIAASCAVPPASFAQIRAGGEFQVNESTLGDQLSPGVSVGGTGDFVVVWSSSVQGGIFGRRYDAAGIPLDSEFRVDTSTTIVKSTPTVASHRRGNFVVAWAHSAPSSIRGVRFDPAAQPLTPEIVLANSQFFPAREPRLSAAPNGWFLLTHLEHGTNPLERGFGFTLFHPTATSGNSMCGFFGNGSAGGGAAATVRRDLSFVGVTANLFTGLEVRHFGSPPCTFGGPVPVTSPGPVSPAIASDAYGNAVLVWTSTVDGDQSGIRGRRLDPLSAPLGAEFQVNGYTTGAQSNPSVAVAADGDFVVAWQSAAGDGNGEAVFARRFRADGSPREDDFVVNTYTTGDQRIPIAAMDANGNFVVAWDSVGGQDGDGSGVFGQRFGGIRAVALSVDAGGNNVLEAGETVAVAPSWRNVNGIAQTFAGSATSFTGPGTPGDPDYTLIDATADYGTVANGASASCAATGNCYRVSVSTPSSRPAVHWDATLREEIIPASFGLSHLWRLHVGESFTDVARTSPFYRFVETLLHNGVTGGCSGTTYCPTGPTTREQMPVFVLVAREGADYGNPVFPLPCVTPPFSDVPTTSPYCRWIQELTRRGVVTGCGNGNYCPSDPVSREQMVVFVLATLEGPGYMPPPCTTPPFADVPVSSPYCRWIQELANRGVVTGCGGGNYCPTAPVTREQMGVFLSVSFGLQLYGP